MPVLATISRRFVLTLQYSYIDVGLCNDTCYLSHVKNSYLICYRFENVGVCVCCREL